MSMYHQQASHHYGQPGYPPYQQPSTAFAQLPSNYGYVQPHYDASTFRREYSARLSELTMNSRPIIQNLSIMAQNFIRYADIVTDCLQAHIRRVPPWMKLPAFYVLDAISKNVSDPYATKFSAFVVPLFLEAHGQVDQPTRSKMEEMLVTWRTGNPSGKELFGLAAQVALERHIWGQDSTSSKPRRRGQPSLNKSQVLTELDVTLARSEQRVQANPYDHSAASHVSVLHQLRGVVERGVSQEELQQILTQLRTMARDSSMSVPSVLPPARPIVQSHVSQISQPELSTSATFLALTGPPQATSAPLATTSNTVPSISGITSLFESLVKAGVVSAGSTPTGAGMSSQMSVPSTSQVSSSSATSDGETSRLDAQKSYAREILNMPIRLTTAEIGRSRPQNTMLLYDRMPLQCKQCALRFHDDARGRADLQTHLDSHFRQNRRAKETAGRGHSRSWFISIQDFVSEQFDLKGKGRANNTSEIDREREAKLRASTVIVPDGEEANSITCPVCTETLKSEFLDEEEEWAWRNAVRVKDKIFHATCHAEMSSSASLISKLRTEEAEVGSRSRTPEREGTLSQGSRSPPKRETPESDILSVKGVKRKANDSNDFEGHLELDGTPPSKKMLLAAA